MRTLYLLRHAKSSWNDASLRDFDRPLNHRGREAAELIGRFLTSEKLSLPLVLSSTALRARETTEIVLKSAGLQAELRYDERIYEANLPRLLEVLSGIEDEKELALLVGHNPGLEELLAFLTSEGGHMPTGALVKMTLAGSTWKGLREGVVCVEWFATPKKLLSR